jgi:hypothetical protein
MFCAAIYCSLPVVLQVLGYVYLCLCCSFAIIFAELVYVVFFQCVRCFPFLCVLVVFMVPIIVCNCLILSFLCGAECSTHLSYIFKWAV